MSSFLKDTVFKILSVFLSSEGSLLLFSKTVHREAKKNYINYIIYIAFSTIFNMVLPDARIGGIEGIFMLFRELFKMVH